MDTLNLSNFEVIEISTKDEFRTAIERYIGIVKGLIAEGKLSDTEIRQFEFVYSPEPAGYANIGGNFNIEEHINRYFNRTHFTCICCGKPVDVGYDNAKNLIDSQLCFSCELWSSRYQTMGSNQYVINGTLYSVASAHSPNYPNPSFLGHSGHPYKIRTSDGKEVITNNLWNGGDLPYWLRPLFTDDHKLISMTPQEYADWWYRSPDEQVKMADQLIRSLSVKMSREEAIFYLKQRFWNISRVARLYHMDRYPEHQWGLKPYSLESVPSDEMLDQTNEEALEVLNEAAKIQVKTHSDGDGSGSV